MSYYETQKKCRVDLGMHIWATYTMFPLYRIAAAAFQLLYRIGFLFPLDYSLIIMIILSDSNYKPETSLTVLFSRKVFRSALRVEFRWFFVGESYKQHQFNIFKTPQTDHKKKKENISWKEQFYIDICTWFWIWSYSFV